MSIKISPVKINYPKITFKGKKTSNEEKKRNMGKLMVASLATGMAVVAGYFLVKIKVNPK